MRQRQHRHHLIPRHMGGGDEEDNLTPPISIEVHAAFHEQLWKDFGKKEDYIAWRCLSGRITGEEARLEAAKEGQKRSDIYKNTRKDLGAKLQLYKTFESCSKGGKVASKSLVEWQRANKQEFKEQCAKNGKINGPKLFKPCVYLDESFESKQALQNKYKMSNTLFYSLLKKGTVVYIDKQVSV
jgi:Domain of unknown function (DUF1996)